MFNDYIDLQKQEMINNLFELISIPSIAGIPKEGKPYGEEINNALEFAIRLAKKMGFKAKNLGTCAEIIYGGDKKSKPGKVYIAGHLDVVPAGDGWTGDPWQATIRNGKIYGRGVLDDKGPSIAVLYALKALKSLGYIPKKEIRLILGGDEEQGMSDIKEYVEKHGLPEYGLTPDSSFPIVNAEAGVIFAKYNFTAVEEKGNVKFKGLQGGNAFNCVPDLCRAVLSFTDDNASEVLRIVTQIEKDFNVEYNFTKHHLSIETMGISAHGSVPDEGKNSIFEMIKFIKIILDKTESSNSYIDFLTTYFVDDTKGKALGIACKDEHLGDLSINAGIGEYISTESIASISMDIRTPVTIDTSIIIKKLEETAKKENVDFELVKEDKSTFMPKESEFLQKLAVAYEKITKKKAEFLSCRGATYAKAFRNRGVAFGPIDETDPSQGGGMHGKDEYLDVESFMNIAKIYAQAIYELWV